MLGTPLPKENNANFETDENFEFSFDIALAPEFNVELSNNDTVDYYDINVTDEMVDQQVICTDSVLLSMTRLKTIRIRIC